MNNPFGIPDDLFISLINGVLEAQKEPQKERKPIVRDFGEMQRKSAKLLKQQMDAYIEAGFTAAQAFELVKSLAGRKN